MATELDAWLALTKEDPIEPELPICDPNHHLWIQPNNRYLLEDFLRDTDRGGHNILSSVYTNCHMMYREDGPEEMRPVGETEFVQNLTAQNANGQYGKTKVAAGIVNHATLTLGTAVEPVLEKHIAAGRGRFRGVRHFSAWDASPEVSLMREVPKGLLLDLKFREGFACLKKYDLVFDVWHYHSQLMDIVDLAKAFPDTTIVVDHTGTPIGIGPYAGKREEVFQAWKPGIVALAECPNIYMKLGGLGMPVCGFGWNKQPKPPNSTELAEVMAPYYNWCIEHFGVNRCMFQSNFPVDKVSYSYTVIWNAFKRFAKDFSPEDKAALFYDTATKVYRI